MLDPRWNTFLVLCETMNYTRAAEQLCLTQPAVTHHIHYLEDHYGWPPLLLRRQDPAADGGRDAAAGI